MQKHFIFFILGSIKWSWMNYKCQLYLFLFFSLKTSFLTCHLFLLKPKVVQKKKHVSVLGITGYLGDSVCSEQSYKLCELFFVLKILPQTQLLKNNTYLLSHRYCELGNKIQLSLQTLESYISTTKFVGTGLSLLEKNLFPISNDVDIILFLAVFQNEIINFLLPFLSEATINSVSYGLFFPVWLSVSSNSAKEKNSPHEIGIAILGNEILLTQYFLPKFRV